jgi:hexosaminidase
MKKNKLVILVAAAVIIIAGCPRKTDYTGFEPAVIPAPVSYRPITGNFIFSDKSEIIVSHLDEQTGLAAKALAGLVKNSAGYSLIIEGGKKPRGGSVFLTDDTTIRNKEGYAIRVTPRNIVIRARSAAGFFYAVQTIRQLLPPEVENHKVSPGFKLTVPSCEIADEPVFKYRGVLLDCARHFFSVAEIKRFIDIMAMHKLNTMQWHLTDDQGWRLEIKKYPKLTEIGAYRKETLTGHSRNKPPVYDGTRYGGFYSQDEVRDIVSYAAERFITIIPEIEMPGHALAALAAYPKISCTGGPFDVRTRWGIEENVFCAGKDETFDFLEDVLTEVTDLFPSEYIHIGGDECPRVKWEKCPACQARIKKEGLKDEKELQSYFIRRIEKFLNSKGRSIIGWDEILEGGLPPDATVMSWRGIKGGIEAAHQGHDVIMTPTNYVYLDYYQTEPEGQPLAIGGYLPLERVYGYDPVPDELNSEEQKHILGIQGNIWTEYIAAPEHLEYMAFPRLFAIAETGWTPERLKDFEDFMARFRVLRTRYDAMGINYFKGEYRDTRKAGKK